MLSLIHSVIRSLNRYLSNAKYVPHAVLAAEGRAAHKISAVRVTSLSAYLFVSEPLHLCACMYMSVSVYLCLCHVTTMGVQNDLTAGREREPGKEGREAGVPGVGAREGLPSATEWTLALFYGWEATCPRGHL